MKQTNRKSAVVLFICGFTVSVFCCGAGIVPYVPSQTGAGTASRGEFFLLEKGVAGEMFDVKKLQPLFRNIVLSGNERKGHKPMGKAKRKKDKTYAQTGVSEQSTEMNQNSQTEEEEVEPILNLHRIH